MGNARERRRRKKARRRLKHPEVIDKYLDQMAALETVDWVEDARRRLRQEDSSLPGNQFLAKHPKRS
jgi:hypothetical protein